MGTTGTPVTTPEGEINTTITKASVLSRVNQICKRSETDIDDILLEAMIEISKRTGSVAELATGTTVAETAYVSQPDDLAGKLVHSFYLNDDPPMKLLTWSQYLNNNFYGYCLYKGRIYIRPTPSNSTDIYYCEYSKIDDDVDGIELDPVFKEALSRLTASKLFGKYQLYDDEDAQLTVYERALRIADAGKDPVDPICENNNWEG